MKPRFVVPREQANKAGTQLGGRCDRPGTAQQRRVAGASNTHGRREHGARPALESLWGFSRSGADRPERLSLELDEAEHIVQLNDLCVLLALLRREQTLGALVRELFDSRRQRIADGI